MTGHLSKQQIEAFCARALEVSEMVTIAEHLASCEVCSRKYHEILQEGRENKPFSISIDEEDLFRNEHLDYEQLASLVENRLNDEELEIVNIHLKACERCREDVRSLIEFRKRVEPDMNTGFEPNPKEP
jgi:anti-sigma factor ChrR (cupin superfamily)